MQADTAVYTYCLAVIVQLDIKLGRSTYEVLKILSISLTDRANLGGLFSET